MDEFIDCLVASAGAIALFLCLMVEAFMHLVDTNDRLLREIRETHAAGYTIYCDGKKTSFEAIDWKKDLIVVSRDNTKKIIYLMDAKQ